MLFVVCIVALSVVVILQMNFIDADGSVDNVKHMDSDERVF